MTKLNLLSAHEMEDVAKVLDDNYSPEKFEADRAEFRQMKKSVLRHRAKLARRKAQQRVLH